MLGVGGREDGMCHRFLWLFRLTQSDRSISQTASADTMNGKKHSKQIENYDIEKCVY